MTDPTPQGESSPPSAEKKGPRVSLMPWDNTGNMAAGGIFVVGAIIALPLIIGVIYMVVRDDPAKSDKPVPTEQAP